MFLYRNKYTSIKKRIYSLKKPAISIFLIPLLFSLIFIPFVKPIFAATGINKQINFQGKVVNSDGTNVANGNYDFIFNIYTIASGGSAIWTESWTTTNQVAVADGKFQVALGSITSLPGSVDFNTDNIYLGITFNGDSEMTPRIQFSSTPYSFNTDTLDGIDSLSFLRSDTDTTYSSGTLSLAATATLNSLSGSTVDIDGDLAIADTDISLNGTSTNFTGTGNISFNTNDLFITKSNGHVGIGTTLPGGLLGISDSNTYIDVDGGNNLTFTDAVSGTKTLAELSSGSSEWTDSGTYVYPSESDTIGDITVEGANKITGIYLADNSPIAFGTSNDFSLDYDSTNTQLELAATNLDFNMALGTGALVLTGSAAGTTALNITSGDLILTDGNVGIGTPTPTSDLNVKGGLTTGLTGTVAVTNLSATVTGTTTAFDTELAVGDSIKIGTEVFTVSAIGSATSLTLDTAYQGATTSGLTAYGDSDLFYVQNGDAVGKLVLDKSGNVGIGTTTPQEKLHITNGTLLVDTPSSPTLTGTYDTGNRAFGTYVSGKYAYVADYTSGLQIIDISNPSIPTLTGTYNTTGEARDVYISGKYAYVADYTSGLQIIDISNPSIPTLTGTYNTTGEARDVYISGKYAYVADRASGLQIIDISDPSNPTQAGIYNTSGTANDVYVSGKYAYVADDASGLQIIDISDPSNPTPTGTYNTSGYAISVYVSGKYAYVADYTSGLQIIDISNPSIPTPAGTYSTSDRAFDVYVSGKYAYVADYSSALEIIDISDPSTLTLKGAYNTSSDIYGIYVSGKYAYLVGDSSGLQIVDIGGADIQTANIGNVKANDITVTENIDVGNNIYARNGLNVGPGGIMSDGNISMIGTGDNYFAGNVGIGTSSPTHKLELAAATTATGGIGFGTDTNLYRSAADTLKTDDALVVTGTFDPNGNVTLPTTGISGAGSGSGLDADKLDNHDTSYFMTAATDNWVNTAGDAMTGTLNMSNSLITNIGNAGTNFTTGGGLTLAGTFDPANVASFTLTGTETLGATYYLNNSGDAKIRYGGFGGANPSSSWPVYVSGNEYSTGVMRADGGFQVDGNTAIDSNNRYHYTTNTSTNKWGSANASGFGIDALNSGDWDLLVYEGQTYTSNLKLGYYGGAVLSSYDTNEALSIRANGSGNINIMDSGTGDINIDSNTLYIDNSANSVGIGTTSPNEALDVGSGNVKMGNGYAVGTRQGNNYRIESNIQSRVTNDMIWHGSAWGYTAAFSSTPICIGQPAYDNLNATWEYYMTVCNTTTQQLNWKSPTSSTITINIQQFAYGPTTNTDFDLAESYKTKDQSIGSGDVVCVDPNNNSHIVKCSKPYDSTAIGIVSTEPGIIIGEELGSNNRLVGLQGRVPVKVTTENGKIERGDLLTPSATKPGYAMKAIKAGQIIGKALQPFDGSSTVLGENAFDGLSEEKIQEIVSQTRETGTGQTMAFINVSWYDPDVYLTSTGDITLDQDLASSTPMSPIYDVLNAGVKVDRVGVFSDAVIGSLRFGSLDGDNVNIDNASIDSLKLNGVDINGVELSSSLSDLDNLSVNVASNSASLASSSASLATVNDQVASLDDRVNNLTSQLNSLSTQVSNLLALDSISSASISGLLVNSSTDLTNAVSIDQPILFLDTALFGSDLYAYADTYLKDTYVDGGISISNSNSSNTNLYIGSNEIYSDSVLKIQSTGLHGIEFLAGKVSLDEYGNMDIKGDFNVEGKINASNINTNNLIASGSASLNNTNVLGVFTATSSATLGNTSIQGDLVASGSANFDKAKVDQLSVGENNAGVVVIGSGETQAHVSFDKAYDATPVVTISTQNSFVKITLDNIDKNGFDIKMQAPETQPVTINWIAIGK